MVENYSTGPETKEDSSGTNEWRRFVKVFFQRRMVIFGLLILIILGFTAIFAEWISPYDPYKQH